MGNKNKQGKKSISAKLIKMSTLPNNQSNDNLKDSSRQTRRSSSKTISPDPKAVEPKKMVTKKPNANITVDNLKAFKDEFMEEISKLKDEIKSNRTKAEQDSMEILNELKVRNQNLKEKYKDKKRLIASMKLDIGANLEKYKALGEELNIITTKYNDSVQMIDLGNRKKIEEISAMQKNVVDLTETIKGLKEQLEKKDEEHKNFVESLKKNHELEILKCQEKYEESVKLLISKEQYNGLVDEYENLKRAFEENEQKLNKTISEKRAVEKSKLQVIRQKEQVKNELLDFVINVNQQLKPTTQFNDHSYDRSSDRSSDRSTDQSYDRSSDRSTDRSYSSLDFDKGNSKFRRPGPPSSANLFTNKRFKRL